MRLLVVDDSKAMRTMLSAYARELSFETAEAADGCYAHELLKNDQGFHGILLDWDMPRMDGMTLLKLLRADPAYSAIKILMVTAQGSYDNIQQALEAGADDYLMKPFDDQMFGDKLRLLGLCD